MEWLYRHYQRQLSASEILNHPNPLTNTTTMKKVLITTLLVLSWLATFAQDVIVKNDKTEIKAKIEEVTETTIKYKKFEMLDGPIYNINKRDVFMVIYKNGTKEYIESTANAPQPATAQQSPYNSTPSAQNRAATAGNQPANAVLGHVKMERIRRGYYSFEGNKLKTYKAYINTFEKYGYQDLAEKAKTARTLQFVGSGAGLVGVGLGLVTGKLLPFLVGGAVINLGISLVGTGMGDKACKEFNQRATKGIGFRSELKVSPTFNSDPLGNHVGVAVRF